MLELVEIDKHKTQALNGNWVVLCVVITLVVRNGHKDVTKSYIKELKVRTRQHSYGRRLALNRSTSQ